MGPGLACFLFRPAVGAGRPAGTPASPAPRPPAARRSLSARSLPDEPGPPPRLLSWKRVSPERACRVENPAPLTPHASAPPLSRRPTEGAADASWPGPRLRKQPAAHYLARKDPREAEGSRAHFFQSRRRRVSRATAGCCGHPAWPRRAARGEARRRRPEPRGLSSPLTGVHRRGTGLPSLGGGQHEPRADWAASRGRRFVSGLAEAGTRSQSPCPAQLVGRSSRRCTPRHLDT